MAEAKKVSTLYNGQLVLTLHSARHLHSVSRLTMDPYCVFTVGRNRVKSSKARHGGTAPTWPDKKFSFNIVDCDSEEIVRIRCKNSEFVVDDTIGEFAVSLARLVSHLGRKHVKLFDLEDFTTERGEVEISIEWSGTPAGQYEIRRLEGPTSFFRDFDEKAPASLSSSAFSVFSYDGQFSLQPAFPPTPGHPSPLIWSRLPNNNHFRLNDQNEFFHVQSNNFLFVCQASGSGEPREATGKLHLGQELAVGVNCGKSAVFYQHESLHHMLSNLCVGFKFHPSSRPYATSIPAVLYVTMPVRIIEANNLGGFLTANVEAPASSTENSALSVAPSQPLVQPSPESLISEPFHIVDTASGLILEPDDNSKLRLVAASQGSEPPVSTQFQWFESSIRHCSSGLVLYCNAAREVYLDSIDAKSGSVLHLQLEPQGESFIDPRGFLLGSGFLHTIEQPSDYLNITRSDREVRIKAVQNGDGKSLFTLIKLVIGPPNNLMRVVSVRQERVPFYLKIGATGKFLATGRLIEDSTDQQIPAGSLRLGLCDDLGDAMQFYFSGPRIVQAFGSFALASIESQQAGERELILVDSPGESEVGGEFDANSWFQYTNSHRLKLLDRGFFLDVRGDRIIMAPGAGIEIIQITMEED